MRPEIWIEDAFGTRSKVRILRLLASDPELVRTERDIAHAIGMSTSSVNAAVSDLRQTGLLEFQRVGRSHAIRLRRGLGVVDSIESFFADERQTLDKVQDAISAVVPKSAACYLYGSTARRTAGPGSDLDVLIVAETLDDAEEVAAAIRTSIERVLPIRVEIIVLDRKAARTRRKSALLENVHKEGRRLGGKDLGDFL